MTLDEIQAVWAANCKERNSEWSLAGSSYRTYRTFTDVLINDQPVSALWCGSEDWRNKDPQSEMNPYGSRRPHMGSDGITYDSCVDWKFDIKNRHLKIIVWDGDFLDGSRRRERAKWVYEIRDEHTKIVAVIENLLRSTIWTQAEKQHAEWLEEQLKRRVQKRFDIMMAKGTT